MNRRSQSAESLTSPTVVTSRIYNEAFKSAKVFDRWTVICLIPATINILNGLWMLIGPTHWYYNLPAGVPEYGPLNLHFIRDIGCTFFALGVGLVFAAFYPSCRLPLFSMNSAFYLLHMLVHVHEMVSGRVRLSMFWMDLPAVYVPAIVVCILNLFMIKSWQNEWKGQIRRK